MQQKKIPLRMCIGCGEMKPKKELVRVVKAPDTVDEAGNCVEKGAISLDLTGKKPGRGAYLCNSKGCLQNARKARKLERSFGGMIPEEVYERLEAELDAGK